MRRLPFAVAVPVVLAALNGFDAIAQQARSAVDRAIPQVVQNYISVDAPVVVLAHVKVIDGTGAAAKEDQSIVIEYGLIRSIGPAADQTPAGAKVLDLTGRTVIPGLVGMHEHMFYLGPTGRGFNLGDGAPQMYPEMAFSFPRLYLAAGVTSVRTTGSMEPYVDLELKHYIDDGRIPGPKMHLTGPYLTGPGLYLPQLHVLTGPEDATRTVNYWADEGFTSFKVYQQITRAELGAVIKAAHARGLKVTGHLCSVTFREAVDLGIDNLEHGLGTDTEFVAGKPADICPGSAQGSLTKLEVSGPEIQSTIHYLIDHHVAITSTLPVAEAGIPNRPPLSQRFLDVLSPASKTDYLIARARASATGDPKGAALHKEEEFEYAFVKEGGVLLAGLDPTGNGAVVAGFGDQREVELLVEAGFTPVEAIHIATENGAKFLGEDDKIGTIAPGKAADLVVIHGDLTKKIDDIEQVETVFKDGKGYDSQKLIHSVEGIVGYR